MPKPTMYYVLFEDPTGSSSYRWRLFAEVYAYSVDEAAEQIANGETGEIGFEGVGAGRYIVFPASRAADLIIDEKPSYRVRKEPDGEIS